MTDSIIDVSGLSEAEAYAALREAKLAKQAKLQAVAALKEERAEMFKALQDQDVKIVHAENAAEDLSRRIQALVQRINDAPPEADEVQIRKVEVDSVDADALTAKIRQMADASQSKETRGDQVFDRCEACEWPNTCRVNGRCEAVRKAEAEAAQDQDGEALHSEA